MNVCNGWNLWNLENSTRVAHAAHTAQPTADRPFLSPILSWLRRDILPQQPMWRLLLLPFLSLLALLPLMPMPSQPATVIGVSRLPPIRSSRAAEQPLLSRLLASSMLAQLVDTPAEAMRVQQAQGPSALASLNVSASPLLTLCPAPECASDDMLVLTLLHKRAAGGPAHDPHRGVVEQWTRPAAHYLTPPAGPSTAGAIAAAAARGGLHAALSALAEAVRCALHPQLLSDPDDWRLLWRQRLPGPAGLLAGSVDGRRLAVSYRSLRAETVTVFIRHFSPPPFDAPLTGRHKRRQARQARRARERRRREASADDDDADPTAEAGPSLDESMALDFEDIQLEGNLPVSAIALTSQSPSGR